MPLEAVTILVSIDPVSAALEEPVSLGAAIVLVSIHLSTVGGDDLTRVELDTSAYFFPHKYKTDDLIFMSLLLIPDWINNHRPSICCS